MRALASIFCVPALDVAHHGIARLQHRHHHMNREANRYQADEESNRKNRTWNITHGVTPSFPLHRSAWIGGGE